MAAGQAVDLHRPRRYARMIDPVLPPIAATVGRPALAAGGSSPRTAERANRR